MADWIKFRKKLLKDGRVISLSRLCHAPRVTVIGALVTLWCIADDYAEENGLLPGYTADDINTEVGIENFAQNMPPDWLTITKEGGVVLPDYQQHNGFTAKKRDQAAVRQTLSRSRHADVTKPSRRERDKSVTRGEEKRREKKREEDKSTDSNESCAQGNEPPTRKNFVPPTLEEVTAFCLERKNSVDPQRWFDHYTANGWMVGKTKMKDWKAAVRTWERNGIQNKGSNNGTSNGRSGGRVGPTTNRLEAKEGKYSQRKNDVQADNQSEVSAEGLFAKPEA